jgi:hypothetical protein
MSVYSQRLAAWEDVGTSGSPYSSDAVPDNYVWVLRCITFGSNADETNTFNLYILSVDGPRYPLVSFSADGFGDYFQLATFDCRHVMNPGDVVQLEVIAGTAFVLASGYQLSNF